MNADRLIIEITLGNDGMQTLGDAAQAIAQALEDDPLPGPLVAGETGRISDVYGNTVGKWEARATQPEIFATAEPILGADAVLGHCPHDVDLDHAFCPHGCRV